jgi:hypothetical protein
MDSRSTTQQFVINKISGMIRPAGSRSLQPIIPDRPALGAAAQHRSGNRHGNDEKQSAKHRIPLFPMRI